MLTQTHLPKAKAHFVKELQSPSRKKRSGKWPSLLDETVIGDFLAIPLTSAKMMKSEAYWMNNCCRDFTESCAHGEYGLFSIRRRTGERLATLGVAKSSTGWCFDQCYGPSNVDVLEETVVYLGDEGELHSESYPTELYYISQEVVRLLNSVEMKLVQ